MEENVNRRDFLGMSLAAVAAVGAGATIFAMKKTWDPLPNVVSGGFTTVDISQIEKGELKTFEWRGQPVYVLKKDSGSEKIEGRDFEINGELYTVGLQVCTHLGCIPTYEKDKKEFLCACHGGQFNSSGVNKKGTPPTRPMEIPPFNIDGTKLVFGEEGDIYKQLTNKA
ncbi:ubiquinol-cytochrome c reductase iron-sulfur subunit [Helicobacter sp. MIT 99-5507]|uniref:ubiquinol-cytochrome c reductase iron-sulfur subunit n=1 Tax=Helicobacter sp. MIT 99-5507 TaxID=152489 RepID=UPI000E1FA417|nr:ubiquinol-cytochrome c reductase iron-sulfur subunit [Helicobacter sp. MIT 99-5507]RDU56519.1 ubiquinol-cytochrome c reductase iron-sulfur subunit [Helicobacter sp. MIT 99-5507]